MSGSALLLELLHEALPEVPIDRGVAQANTGNFFCDVLPLLTIAPMASVSEIGGAAFTRWACLAQH
jgi:hypothetical protein